jgi:hypothetical protein
VIASITCQLTLASHGKPLVSVTANGSDGRTRRRPVARTGSCDPAERRRGRPDTSSHDRRAAGSRTAPDLRWAQGAEDSPQRLRRALLASTHPHACCTLPWPPFRCLLLLVEPSDPLWRMISRRRFHKNRVAPLATLSSCTILLLAASRRCARLSWHPEEVPMRYIGRWPLLPIAGGSGDDGPSC